MAKVFIGILLASSNHSRTKSIGIHGGDIRSPLTLKPEVSKSVVVLVV